MKTEGEDKVDVFTPRKSDPIVRNIYVPCTWIHWVCAGMCHCSAICLHAHEYAQTQSPLCLFAVASSRLVFMSPAVKVLGINFPLLWSTFPQSQWQRSSGKVFLWLVETRKEKQKKWANSKIIHYSWCKVTPLLSILFTWMISPWFWIRIRGQCC